jgi:signal transduction histidine kinase
MVAITVGDDRPGIPPAERARVAQPGTRLDERGDGHGFGLAIVAELAALYGGTMALDEAPGGGLAVRLLLPAA